MLKFLALWIFCHVDAALITDKPWLVHYNEGATFSAYLVLRNVPNFGTFNAVFYKCKVNSNTCTKSTSPFNSERSIWRIPYYYEYSIEWNTELNDSWDDVTLEVRLINNNNEHCLRNWYGNQKIARFNKLNLDHASKNNLYLEFFMDWGGRCRNNIANIPSIRPEDKSIHTENAQSATLAHNAGNKRNLGADVVLNDRARSNFDKLFKNELFQGSVTPKKPDFLCNPPLVSPTDLDPNATISTSAVFICASSCGDNDRLSWWQRKKGRYQRINSNEKDLSTKLILNITLQDFDQGSIIYCLSDTALSSKIIHLNFSIINTTTTMEPYENSSNVEVKSKSGRNGVLVPVISGCVAVLILMILFALIFIKLRSRTNNSTPKTDERTEENDINYATTGVNYAILDLGTPSSNTRPTKDPTPYTEIIGAYRPKGQVGF